MVLYTVEEMLLLVVLNYYIKNAKEMISESVKILRTWSFIKGCCLTCEAKISEILA